MIAKERVLSDVLSKIKMTDERKLKKRAEKDKLILSRADKTI